MPSVQDLANTLSAASKKLLEPDGRRLAEGLIRQGYAFDQAIADVVDNAVDEGARHILIRLMLKPKGGFDVLIADDGSGMTPLQLEEGMRVGSRMRKEASKLGKFGLGLKQASLSQCKRLIVASRARSSTPCACGWDNEGLKASMADVWGPKAAIKFLEREFSGLDLSRHGTVVYWQEVESDSSPETVQGIRRDLKIYLGVHFHRFLEGKTKILVDMPTLGEKPTNLPFEEVSPIDPFTYRNSGDDQFPKTFRVRFKNFPALSLQAHVLPHKKDQNREERNAYKLYKGANNASGFYVYRNRRLIVAGEWFGRLKHEPHSSLSRIAFELPAALDDFVRLNVQKVGIQFPREFLDAVWSSKCGAYRFKDYIQAAEKAYRTRTGKQQLKDYPLIPHSGLPSQVRKIYANLIKARRGKYRKATFTWTKLDKNELFSVDTESKSLLLNENYRDYFRQGERNGKADAPLLKMALFLLTEPFIDSERVRAQQKTRIELLNKSLVACIKQEARK